MLSQGVLSPPTLRWWARIVLKTSSVRNRFPGTYGVWWPRQLEQDIDFGAIVIKRVLWDLKYNSTFSSCKMFSVLMSFYACMFLFTCIFYYLFFKIHLIINIQVKNTLFQKGKAVEKYILIYFHKRLSTDIFQKRIFSKMMKAWIMLACHTTLLFFYPIDLVCYCLKIIIEYKGWSHEKWTFEKKFKTVHKTEDTVHDMFILVKILPL